MSEMYDIPEKDEKDSSTKLGTFLGAVGSFLFSSIEGIISAVAIAVALYLFIFTPHEVVGSSMHPTYVNGEYLLANKLTYKLGDYNRGDVVIFMHSETKDYIKRIIGLPGESISIRDGHILINGEVLDETNYLGNTVITEGSSFLAEGSTMVVPDGKLFVCGDNRGNSSDSRAFGFINQEDVKGKVWVVYFPFSDFRVIKDPTY